MTFENKFNYTKILRHKIPFFLDTCSELLKEHFYSSCKQITQKIINSKMNKKLPMHAVSVVNCS